MKFLIITHVAHIKKINNYFAYSPYVREMNVYGKFVDELIVVGTYCKDVISPIHIKYEHPSLTFIGIDSFSLTSLKNIVKSLFIIPSVFWKIYGAMRNADHIHLRCPGNVGLVGCLVQILFPRKKKTAKYAGNWDPNSKQPLSYRLQKWILNNTFLTRNMQVLVYGEWENSTSNIKSFFTASYREMDKKVIQIRSTTGIIHFLFVGTLSKGKRPEYAIRLVEKLDQLGYDVRLDLYGEGSERKVLEAYIAEHGLQTICLLHGNQEASTVQTAYENSHFLILPSQSEGWPKVIAEAMFWGCVPIASAVSCVPNMLENGTNGVILKMELEKDVTQLKEILANEAIYQSKAESALKWSRRYTLDYFEKEVESLLGLN